MASCDRGTVAERVRVDWSTGSAVSGRDWLMGVAVIRYPCDDVTARCCSSRRCGSATPAWCADQCSLTPATSRRRHIVESTFDEVEQDGDLYPVKILSPPTLEILYRDIRHYSDNLKSTSLRENASFELLLMINSPDMRFKLRKI